MQINQPRILDKSIPLSYRSNFLFAKFFKSLSKRINLIGGWGHMLQEVSGSVALAVNPAPLGENILINGDFANWTGIDPDEEPDDWAVTITGGADANTKTIENPAGECQIISDGTLIQIAQAIVEIGKEYTVELDVNAITGTFVVQLGSVIIGTVTTTGAKSFSGISNGTNLIIKRAIGQSVNTTIDNVVVREVGKGRNVVINGDFATDTIWTKGANWAIAGNVATHTAGATATLSQTGILAVSKIYELTYTISNRTAGSITPTNGVARTTNDTFTEEITSTGTALIFTPSSDFDGDISNVSVKQTSILASTAFPGSELVSNGGFDNGDDWIIGGPEITISGGTCNWSGAQAGNVAVEQDVLTTPLGKRYRIEFDLTDVSAGTIQTTAPFLSDTIGASGHYVLEATGDTAADRLIFQGNSTFVGKLDNVSVTEVNPLNGDNTGATVGQKATKDIGLAYSFDGGSDFVDIHSAELNSIFDPTKGTLIALCKVANAGVWEDGVERYISLLFADGDNQIYFRKNSTNNQLRATIEFGGITETQAISNTSIDYFMIALTWDKSADGGNGEFKGYLNGVQSGSTQAIGGTWVGNLSATQTIIGALVTTPTNVMDGFESSVGYIRQAESPAQMLKYAQQAGVA